MPIRGARLLVMIGAAAPARDAAPAPEPPQVLFADLFVAVQSARVFEDGKEFADAVPKTAPALILADYRAQRPATPEALRRFVAAHFTLPAAIEPPAASPDKISITDHIDRLWGKLTRSTPAAAPYASLLPCPIPTSCPAGVFAKCITGTRTSPCSGWCRAAVGTWSTTWWAILPI